jgi:hypothetical protein
VGQIGINRPIVKLHDPAWRQLQKYKMARFDGPKISLPYGYSADGSAYVGVRPPGSNRHVILHSPESLMLKPKPNATYCWRKRNDDMTYGLVESHQIQPVPYDALDLQNPASAYCFPYAGPGGLNYCGYGTLGLFEVKPRFAYEWFEHPADYSMAKMLTRSEDFRQEVEGKTEGKMTGHIEVRDVRKGS